MGKDEILNYRKCKYCHYSINSINNTRSKSGNESRLVTSTQGLLNNQNSYRSDGSRCADADNKGLDDFKQHKCYGSKII